MRLNNPSRIGNSRCGMAAIISNDRRQGPDHRSQPRFRGILRLRRGRIAGQPHNILRHPDMPVEAFRDLWDTLKSCGVWSGLVKNRRKDGDHYWVRASVTPLADGAYMSVRQKPGRDEVARAEALYRDMHEGRSPARLYCIVARSTRAASGSGWRSYSGISRSAENSFRR